MGHIPFYALNMMIGVLPVLPFALLSRLLAQRRLRRLGRQTTAAHEVVTVIFILFISGLLYLTVDFAAVFRGGFTHSGNVNLIPLRTIRSFLGGSHYDAFVINVVGNIAMFVPIGLLIPLLWRVRRPFFSAAISGAGLSLFIEAFQFFCDRSTDVDDFLLNTLGALCGWVVFALIHAVFPRLCARFLVQKRYLSA